MIGPNIYFLDLDQSDSNFDFDFLELIFIGPLKSRNLNLIGLKQGKIVVTNRPGSNFDHLKKKILEF